MQTEKHWIEARAARSSRDFRLAPVLEAVRLIAVDQQRHMLFIATVAAMVLAAVAHLTLISLLYLALALPCLLAPQRLQVGAVSPW